MTAKLVFVHVLSGDTGRSVDFYGRLFGRNLFARSLTDAAETYHMPISSDGIDLNISAPFAGKPPRIVPFFAVDNLATTVESLTAAGGKKIADVQVAVPAAMFGAFQSKASPSLSREAPGLAVGSQLGTATLMFDPDGNPIGVIQLEAFVHPHFKFGDFSQPLTAQQLEDHALALQIEKEVFFTRK
jgi:predicted enzyme related to lactoylglutathione lyase